METINVTLISQQKFYSRKVLQSFTNENNKCETETINLPAKILLVLPKHSQRDSYTRILD